MAYESGHLDEDTVGAFVAGYLATAALQHVDAHLAECPVCRELVADAAYGADDSKRLGAVDAPSHLTSEVIGERYQVEAYLGAGGMGSVWRAFDLQTRRHVAIKRLPSGSFEAAQQFKREVHAMARLRHPNLVSVLDSGTTPQNFYLVMELVLGTTLSERLKQQGRLLVASAIDFASQIAAGLAAAHAERVVHRDLKPSNIMLHAEPEKPECIKLVDFGIARLIDLKQLSRSGAHFVGTPSYASPEQAVGADATASSDLYCLGLVLYEMVVGHPPFHAATPIGLLLQHARAVPLPPSFSSPDVPGWLDTLIMQLLAKDSAARLPSAEAVIECLEAKRPWKHSTPKLGGALTTTMAVAVANEGGPSQSIQGAASHGGTPLPLGARVYKMLAAPRLSILWFLFYCGLVLEVSLLAPALPSGPPIVIDDFEGTGLRASGKMFARWEAYTVGRFSGTELETVAMWKIPAQNSNRALKVAWRVKDVRDDKNERPSANLQVRPEQDYVDLSRNSRIVFRIRYDGDVAWPDVQEPLSPAFQWVQGETLELYPFGQRRRLDGLFAPTNLAACSHAAPTSAVVTFQCREFDGAYRVRFALSGYWEAVTIKFSELRAAVAKERGSRSECLALTDLIVISIDPPIHDGECHSGAIAIDDISIR